MVPLRTLYGVCTVCARNIDGVNMDTTMLYSCSDFPVLPELPRQIEADWVRDKLQNLVENKCMAWLQLVETALYTRITKASAEKATAAAAKRACAVEQVGHRDFLMQELRFCSSTLSLLHRNGHALSIDDKLQHLAEHLEQVEEG